MLQPTDEETERAGEASERISAELGFPVKMGFVVSQQGRLMWQCRPKNVTEAHLMIPFWFSKAKFYGHFTATGAEVEFREIFAEWQRLYSPCGRPSISNCEEFSRAPRINRKYSINDPIETYPKEQIFAYETTGRFNVGARIRYIPGHAEDNPDHPDCEDGTVSSLGETCVRVRFDKDVKKHGWEGATAQACDPRDLRLLSEIFIRCSSCDGRGESEGFACGPKGGGYGKLPCLTCDSTGSITSLYAERLVEAAAFREERRKRKATLREEAARLGVSFLEMNDIEHGRGPETEAGHQALGLRRKEVMRLHPNNLAINSTM